MTVLHNRIGQIWYYNMNLTIPEIFLIVNSKQHQVTSEKIHEILVIYSPFKDHIGGTRLFYEFGFYGLSPNRLRQIT